MWRGEMGPQLQPDFHCANVKCLYWSGILSGTFQVTSRALSLKLQPPHLAFTALTLFDPAVRSVWALRFNNARNSPGTGSNIFMLISSLGPALGSCTVESALTFWRSVLRGQARFQAARHENSVHPTHSSIVDVSIMSYTNSVSPAICFFSTTYHTA